MILLFLPLLITAASATRLIDQFECGPDKLPHFLKLGIEHSIDHCNYAVIDNINLCCKAHDLCFDVHRERSFSREFCDNRFCNCLQEASARNNYYQCANHQHLFCSAARKYGEQSYLNAWPNEHKDLLAKFEDQHPWGLDMQSLVNACRYSRELAIHCHNSAVRCLAKDHERIKRVEEEEAIVTHAYEDCRSTMHDCLDIIILSEPSENCEAVARSIGKQVNVYTNLDEKKHGKSIIDTYSIIASRLIKQCSNSERALNSCFFTFDRCAQNNRRENPKLYNAVRRIKIECHLNLKACIDTATSRETSEDCWEARALAIDRIRSIEMQPEKSFKDAILDLGLEKVVGVWEDTKEIARGVARITSDAGSAAVDAVAETAVAAKNWAGEKAEAAKDWVGSWLPGR